jgi:hypothetical protein
MTKKSKLKWHKITNSCKMSKNYKFIENGKQIQIHRKWQKFQEFGTYCHFLRIWNFLPLSMNLEFFYYLNGG